MAEGDVTKYNNFLEQLLLGTFNLATNALRVMMVSGYTPNRATHSTYGNVSANEVTGTGYTAGGKPIASPVVAQDDVNNRASFDFADLTWTALQLAQTPSHAILFRQGGTITDAAGLLCLCWELGRVTNGGDYTLTWPNDVLRLS